jgi:alanyl-tRNA synthetase
MIAKAQIVGTVKLVASLCTPDAEGIKRLRDLSDRIKQKEASAVIILGMKDPASEKASILVAVGPQAPKSLNANDLLKELALFIDGRGGGKPDLAQAGGTKAAGLQEAIKAALGLVTKKLGA